MAVCSSCAYFGKKNGMYWCLHPNKDWSTDPDNSACSYYKSSW